MKFPVSGFSRNRLDLVGGIYDSTPIPVPVDMLMTSAWVSPVVSCVSEEPSE